MPAFFTSHIVCKPQLRISLNPRIGQTALFPIPCISVIQAEGRKKTMRWLVLEHLEDAGRWSDPHMRIEPEAPGDTAFFWNQHPLSTLSDRQILRPASVTKLALIQ